MRGTLIALDLETTGLDVNEAHIIEIGAAKFRDSEMLETLTMLVDPGIPLPPRISDITGIKPDDLLGAPKLVEVLPKLIRFVGDAPIVGHNVDFDLRFLHKQKVLLQNPAIDTYEMAAVLMPTAPRYNLNALMQSLQIEPEGAYHRALTDAIADGRLYWAMWHKLLHEVPVGVVREIAALAAALPWKGKLAFEEAVKVRESERASQIDPITKAFSLPAPAPIPPEGAGSGTPDLDPEKLKVTLAFALPEDNPSESYQQQSAVLQAVTEAYTSEKNALIEAPGGHPASYVLPAALWAAQTGERTLIVAGTDHLRGRLISHDIPGALAAAGINGLRTALVRPRSKYLCPAQVGLMRQHGAATTDELRLLSKTLVWLSFGGDPYSGESPSIRGMGEQLTWKQLSAEKCSDQRCRNLMNGICPLHHDQVRAQSAHLVVVDQGTLAEDKMTPGGILPAYSRVIVDETHLLEDNATDALHLRLDAYRIKREMTTLGTAKSGLLGAILNLTKAALPEKTFTGLAGGIGNVAEAAQEMSHHMDRLFAALRTFTLETADARPSEFSITHTLTDALRGKPAYRGVQSAWDSLSQYIGSLTEILPQLVSRLSTLRDKYNLPRLGELSAGLERLIESMNGYHRWLEAFLIGRDSNAVFWIEIKPDVDGGSVVLHSAPISLAGLFNRHIWANQKTAILTGARLQVDGTYDLIQGRLGASDFETHSIQPEDAQSSRILVYQPSDLPDPKETDKTQKALARAILELSGALEGRIFVLFTSFMQLRQVSSSIGPRLTLGGIPLFDQADGTEQRVMLEGFRASPRAVLLGVRGNWDELSDYADDVDVFMVVKLPFAVPSDPIVSARSATYPDYNSEYTIPNAVLRFRGDVDGFLRGRRKRGVMVILDKRIITKGYGGSFLESLPTGQRLNAPLGDLPQTAQKWLASS